MSGQPVIENGACPYEATQWFTGVIQVHDIGQSLLALLAAGAPVAMRRTRHDPCRVLNDEVIHQWRMFSNT